MGVKLGDDVDEIDLDLTLEKYTLAKQFLTNILEGFTAECAVDDLDDILSPAGLDRLVLASGGVARDFLGIFRRSVQIAREKVLTSERAASRGTIGAEEVNAAAGEYESSKREELKKDALGEQERLEASFERIRSFCFNHAKANIFLVEQDARVPEYGDIQELMDLRLVHKVRKRVTAQHHKGKLFEVYMLDVSQYAGQRARKGFDICHLLENSGHT